MNPINIILSEKKNTKEHVKYDPIYTKYKRDKLFCAVRSFVSGYPWGWIVTRGCAGVFQECWWYPVFYSGCCLYKCVQFVKTHWVVCLCSFFCIVCYISISYSDIPYLLTHNDPAIPRTLQFLVHTMLPLPKGCSSLQPQSFARTGAFLCVITAAYSGSDTSTFSPFVATAFMCLHLG